MCDNILLTRKHLVYATMLKEGVWFLRALKIIHCFEDDSAKHILENHFFFN